MSLIPAGSSSGSRFEQQGTVDWVSLSKETVGFSVQILSQLARGGVHPYTLVIGQHIGNSFSFSAAGRRNFTKALQELKYFKGFDDIIRFGFGIECLPRLLSTTEQGTLCAALCSALSEFYHEDVAAEILFELAKLIQLPEEFNPSMLEWRSLLRVFQGVLSTSHFSLIVEQIRRLLPTQDHRNLLGYGLIRGRDHRRASAGSVAAVLRALGNVTREQVVSITVTGHVDDLAWIGTVSSWLFSLRTTVTIKGASGHQLVYSNCPEDEPQCSLVFCELEAQPCRQLESTQTFRLSEDEDVISRSDNILVGTSRVDWKECLFFTFGEDFRHLLEDGHTIGLALGSAARILEQSYLRKRSDERIGACHKSGGFLIDVLLGMFPELSCIRAPMEQATTMSYTDAASAFERAWQSITLACGCKACIGDSHRNSRRYCPSTLLKSLICLGVLFSSTHVAVGLFPTVAGLKAFYQQQAYWLHGDRILDDVFNRAGKTFRSSAQLLLLLFTGRDWKDQINVVAVAHSGICVYMHALRELPSTPTVEFRLYVTPGKIEFKQHHYEHVVSQYTSTPSPRTDMLPSDACWDVSLLITPKMNALHAAYRAKAEPVVFDFSVHGLIERLDELLFTPRCRQTDCAKVRNIELVDPPLSYLNGLAGRETHDYEDGHEHSVNYGQSIISPEDEDEDEDGDGDGDGDVHDGNDANSEVTGSVSIDSIAEDSHVDRDCEQSFRSSPSRPSLFHVMKVDKRPFYFGLMHDSFNPKIDRVVWKRDCCWDCCLIFALDELGANLETLVLDEDASTLFPILGDTTDYKILVTR
jgi:hypothetical protein